MKNLIKTLKKVSLLILAISFIGCDDDEAILPQLTAGFTHTINANTGTVTFINTSINASMYEWDFGDEVNTSRLINPVNVYENGTYTVILKASNVAGAFDIFSDEITINVAEVEGTCDAETAESLSASDLNMTFMSDPTASITSDGAGFSWIDNPDSDNTVNTSCKVGQIDRTSASQYANNQIVLDAKLDFNSNTGFKLKVWSPTASTNVLLKLEDQSNAGLFKEIPAVTSADSAGAWEELTFDFESADSNKFDKIVLFFELNSATEQTYYIDDLMLYGEGNGNGGGGGGGGACTPETVESYSAANVNMTFQTDPSADFISDGSGFSWVDNPDFDNAVNNSCKVAQVVRGNNNPWDNNQYDLDAKLDFNANTGFKIKVWSERPSTEVRLKLEEIGNAGNNTEQFLTTSVTSGWEEMTFPFTAADSNKFNKIVLFFDLNTDSTATYYFDDLMLYSDSSGGGGGGGGGTGSYNLTLPIDFETTGHGANWAWNVFENDTNPPLEFVANPNASGINTSTTVAKITALQAGEAYVGTETVHGEMGITWDLSASNSTIKIMVYKTVISDVGVKLVNPSGGAQAVIKVANTVVNAWEELTFDFTDRIGNGLDGSTNIDQIVVFPDFNARTSDNVIYFDNITFE